MDSSTVPAPVLTSPKGSSPSPTTVQDTMVATPSITDVVMCASPKTMQEDVVMSTSPNIVQQNIMMDTDTSPSGFGAQDRRSPSQFLDEEQLEMYLDYFADTATKTKDGQDFFKLLLSHEGNYSIARVHSTMTLDKSLLPRFDLMFTSPPFSPSCILPPVACSESPSLSASQTAPTTSHSPHSLIAILSPLSNTPTPFTLRKLVT